MWPQLLAEFQKLWIKLQVRNFKSFLVCTTYRPPNVPTTCFNTDLSSSLVAALLYNKPVYILGDLNCNLLDLNTPESQALIKFCQTFNLSQVVTKPTRLTDKSESLLDVILVSNANQVLESDVLISSISDHDLVYMKLRLKRQKSPPIFTTTRSFKNYSPSEFLKDIATSPWSVLDTFDDPDDKLFVFNVLFNDVLDQHAPGRRGAASLPIRHANFNPCQKGMRWRWLGHTPGCLLSMNMSSSFALLVAIVVLASGKWNELFYNLMSVQNVIETKWLVP